MAALAAGQPPEAQGAREGATTPDAWLQHTPEPASFLQESLALHLLHCRVPCVLQGRVVNWCQSSASKSSATALQRHACLPKDDYVAAQAALPGWRMLGPLSPPS